jgi:hypothetical protein
MNKKVWKLIYHFALILIILCEIKSFKDEDEYGNRKSDKRKH